MPRATRQRQIAAFCFAVSFVGFVFFVAVDEVHAQNTQQRLPDPYQQMIDNAKLINAQREKESESHNFRDRQAIIINNAPSFVELSDFKFGNNHEFKFNTHLRWKNTSDKPITAFEVVVLGYDPFNRPLHGGGRWLITGRSSGDWTALSPGETAGDGLIGSRDEPALTSIVYLRAIRFQDGTIWNSDTRAVEKAIRERLPVLKELGDINPPIEKQKDR